MPKYEPDFVDEAELIDSLRRGGDVEFLYNGKKYSITPYNGSICVCEFYNEASEKIYADPAEAVGYEIEGKRIGDILQDMKVLFRSL